jgi:hypothetical protein
MAVPIQVQAPFPPLSHLPALCCTPVCCCCGCCCCCDPCAQFERACKEVLQDDHQLTAEGEEQHFEDVQVGAGGANLWHCCAWVTRPGHDVQADLQNTCVDVRQPVGACRPSHVVC